MNQNVLSDYQKAIIKAIEYHLPRARIVLFGSRARGAHAPGADIDVAIDIGHPIKLREMTRIRATLENLPISLEIDIVDMNNISAELKAIIKREGIVWKD